MYTKYIQIIGGVKLTSTEWNGEYRSSPCKFKGEKCANEKKGLINGKMHDCRLTCEDYQLYDKVRCDKNNIVNKAKKDEMMVNSFVCTSIASIKQATRGVK